MDRVLPRARQAKSKARYQRYEDLLKKASDKQTQTAQIVIPVAERLGRTWSISSTSRRATATAC